MKRDLDLIRHILMALEESSHSGLDHPLPGVAEDVVRCHCYLLMQAGLIEATEVAAAADEHPQAAPRNLTWAGHEFIAAARTAQRWERAKKVALESTGVLSFAAVQAVLSKWISEAVFGRP